MISKAESDLWVKQFIFAVRSLREGFDLDEATAAAEARAWLTGFQTPQDAASQYLADAASQRLARYS